MQNFENQSLIPSKPQFNVKAKGQEGYIGSAWLQDGKFGPYISIKLNCKLSEGSTIYLHPRRDFSGVIKP